MTLLIYLKLSGFSLMTTCPFSATEEIMHFFSSKADQLNQQTVLFFRWMLDTKDMSLL